MAWSPPAKEAERLLQERGTLVGNARERYRPGMPCSAKLEKDTVLKWGGSIYMLQPGRLHVVPDHGRNSSCISCLGATLQWVSVGKTPLKNGPEATCHFPVPFLVHL